MRRSAVHDRDRTVSRVRSSPKACTRSCGCAPTRAGSRRRSRSCRIPPIATCSSSSSRTAASASCARRCPAGRLSRPVGGDRLGRRAGAARACVPAGHGDERPVLRQLHQSLRRHRRRAAFDGRRPVVADPASRFDLRWGGARRARVHRAAVRQSQRRPSRVRARRLSSTSASATAVRATIPRIARRTRRSFSERCCGSTSACRTPTRRVSGAAGQSVSRAADRRSTRPEIWAFGLRNPWRYAFDDPARGGTGALVIGDVGQSRCEEIDYEPADAADATTAGAIAKAPTTTSRRAGRRFCRSIDPIHEYSHSVGQSITGGYVYRGDRASGRSRGRYFFADFVQGRLFSLALDARRQRRSARLGPRRTHGGARRSLRSSGNISSFGVDADGELLIVSYCSGVS